MIDENEWQKFLIDCNVYKNKVDVLISTTKEQEDRIARLEKDSTKTDFQYQAIMATLNKLTEQTIPALSKEIQALKNKPVERYNTVVIAIISAVVSGVIGFVISRLLN